MDFQKELVKYTFERLQGSHEWDKQIHSDSGLPSKNYILGNLASQAPEDEADYENRGRASIRAGRLRVSVPLKSLDNGDSKAKISVSGSVFYQSVDEGEKVWKREDFKLAQTLETVGDSKNLDFSSVIKSVNGKSTKQVPTSCWSASVECRVDRYEDQEIVRVDLTNTARKSSENYFEHTLFNVTLDVEFTNLKSSEFRDEYYYESFRQRFFYDFRTVNCQAKWVNGEKTKFRTQHYDVFNQPNIVPRYSLEGIDFSFKTFSGDNASESLRKILLGMNEKLEIYKSNASSNESGFLPRQDNKQSTWEERHSKIKEFERTIVLFERGIELLDSNEEASASFKKMNETFDDYWTNKLADPGVTPSWRLFQIIFIVASLRSVVNNEDLDEVDVLHVMTGGGKSEAYFGLVVFTMFFERITGKTTGVTAIVKFPLRMLSIQQLERLSSIVMYSETIRSKDAEIFQGDPFSAGFFVGKSEDFPNSFYPLRDKISQSSEDLVSHVISDCPLCEPGNRGNMILKLDEDSKRVIHVCSKDSSHKAHIYMSDREIYHWRPSVLVSTVDKWAGLASQRRAGVLLGGKGSMCPHGHGFVPLGDCCEDKRKEIECTYIGEHEESLSGLGPRLSIQDEAHLLKEGFGAINSHFESLIECLIEENCNHKLKHITMSATLRGTQLQNKELYNKKSVIIPGSSPEGEGSSDDFFYVTKDDSKRLIYGMKPNQRDNHFACLRHLNIAFDFIKRSMEQVVEDAEGFAKKYGLKGGKSEAIDIIKRHFSYLTYHHKVQDAIEMERMSYVELDKWNVSSQRILIGNTSLEELKETIDSVRKTVKELDLEHQLEEGPFFGPVHATSVVSHGIDIEEWNFMLFQGIPHSTGEYIQALSRVGRKHRGVVVVWFYPNRVRDDSFYSNFERYHEVIDHEVNPIPINRIARLAVLQTINSIFCAGVLHFLSNKLGKPIYNKSHLDSISSDDPIWNEFGQFISRVYGRTLDDVNLSVEIDERRKCVRTSAVSRDSDLITKVLATHPNPYFRTQTGMRGIQKQQVLQPWSSTRYAVENLEG